MGICQVLVPRWAPAAPPPCACCSDCLRNWLTCRISSTRSVVRVRLSWVFASVRIAVTMASEIMDSTAMEIMISTRVKPDCGCWRLVSVIQSLPRRLGLWLGHLLDIHQLGDHGGQCDLAVAIAFPADHHIQPIQCRFGQGRIHIEGD